MKEKLCLMLKNRGSKARLMIVLSFVLTTTVLGATYAYTVHKNELENLLKAHIVSGEVIEEGASVGESKDYQLTPGANTAKRVQFKNTGDVAVFLRVAYSETWVDKDGKPLAHVASYATPTWTTVWTSSSGEWTNGGDGWYYYKKILKAGDTTAQVLSGVSFLSTPALPSDYAGGDYQLTFVMEVVQCSDETTVNNNALSKTFGKTATVTGMDVDKGTVIGGNISWS